MSSDMNLKTIHHKKLAGFLLLTGCRLLNVEEDGGGRFIFYFKDSKKTQENIKAFFGNAKVNIKGE